MTQGERVKKVRKSFNLTLEKFGEKLGVKKNAICQIENGRNSLTNQMCKAICREFNVNPDWLFNGNEPMYEDINKNKRLPELHQETLSRLEKLNDEQVKIVLSFIDFLDEVEKSHSRPLKIDFILQTPL